MCVGALLDGVQPLSERLTTVVCLPELCVPLESKLTGVAGPGGGLP